MAKPITFFLGQVVQTVNPTQFDQGFIDEETDEDLLPGCIRVRTTEDVETSASERYAFPADSRMSQVPLYGEQVICFTAIDGKAPVRSEHRLYYLPFTLNVHSNINNNILPFIYNSVADEITYSEDGITVLNPDGVPDQLSFDVERDIVAIQPFQGDTIIQSRYGSVLRFSGTHAEIGPYKETPFYRNGKVGDPFIALTCEVKGVTTGDSQNDFYKVEEPNQDGSFLYMSSTQKFTRLNLAQPSLGTGVQAGYQKPQVIIGSDRLIFNAKNDELILVSATDVKVSTPKWATDMDDFFSLIEELMEEIDKIANTKETIATGAGPTGIATNAAKFTDILSRFQRMKQ